MQTRPLPFPRKIVLPSSGDLELDCGKCGGRVFSAHVRAANGRGRLIELVCKNCLKVFKLDDKSMFEGDGHVTIHGKPAGVAQ